MDGPTGPAERHHAAREWPASKIERRRVVSLRPFERNARTHSPEQVRQVAESIKQWGWTMPVLIDEADEIIAGHARVLAAQLISIDEVPCIVARGWSSEQKRAYVIADNKLALNGGWDEGLLRMEMGELKELGFDLGLTGFGVGELQEMFGSGASTLQGNTEPDAVPPAPALPTTKRGEVWTLDHHRLMCGDCRDPVDMQRLCGDARVHLAFTSPPYAEQRAYDAASGFEKIAPEHYVEWFRSVAEGVRAHLADDGSWFVNIKPASSGLDTSLYVFDLVVAHVREWGWHFVTELCWQRPGVPKQVVRRFKNQFEPIYQFVRGEFKMRPDNMRVASDHVPKARGTGAGNTSWGEHQGGGRTITASKRQGEPGFEWFNPMHQKGLAYPGNLLPTFMGSHTAHGHAAAFPVGLPQWFINAYTDAADIVLDPFMGSGSTLIAAEGTKRRARGMELSPLYVDVQVMRWQEFTGRVAHLDGDGRTFAEVQAERLGDEARSATGSGGAAGSAREPAKDGDAGRRAGRRRQSVGSA